MRIGIDARFLTHPQVGGFKTYTVNLVNALSQVDQDNQYVLYTDHQPTAENGLPQAKNFTYRNVPATLPLIGMPLREQVLLRQQIARDKLDVAHFLCNTAPVVLPQNSILSLLDVIQVKTPQHFPTTKGLEDYRRWAISAYSKWAILKTAPVVKKIITLSEYEKGEIVKHLDIAPERVHVTYFGVNSVFSPASPQTRATWREQIRDQHGVHRKFIMGVGYEPRKNITLLIEAFAQLACTFPDLDLVVVAAEKERRVYFKQLAAELGVAERVIILPALQPVDLAVLYNLTELFVFPSIRESFGAPPLEALACGAPTLAMNMTSLPEVLGDGAILLDGTDVSIWANMIERMLTDCGLRADLIQRGLRQAAKLTWKHCAEGTIQVYEEILAGSSKRSHKIAQWS